MGVKAVFIKFTISLLTHEIPEIKIAPSWDDSIISPVWVSYFA
jgi:hypothetical protein